VLELVYMLREAAKSAAQNEVRIPIESLWGAIRRLLEEDRIATCPSEEGLHEDLMALQNLSLLTVRGGVIVLDRDAFLDATEYVERDVAGLLEALDDRYALAVLRGLKQRAREILPPGS
jgi:hypothetical protein